MLQSLLLFYKKFRKDLEKEGFKFNPYDPCVANKMVNGKQMTVVFHVDDAKVSHKDKKVVDEFHQWADFMYGDPKIGAVTATRGPIHDYLGMTLDFSIKNQVKIQMEKYVESMINEFPEELKNTDTVMSPSTSDLFQHNNSNPLSKSKAEIFHTMVAKALFLSKRAWPDIQPTVAYLCTRVKEPNQTDWAKLQRLMKCLNGTYKNV